jgi:uncharacterized protein (TIGR00369 family)
MAKAAASVADGVRMLLQHIVDDEPIAAATSGKYRRLLADKTGDWGLDWDAISGPHYDDGGAVYFPFTVTPALGNAFGVLHGGIVGSMVDTLTSLVAIASTGQAQAVSVEIRLTYLRSLRVGAKAIFRTVLLRHSSTQQYLEAEIVSAADPSTVIVHGTHLKTIPKVSPFPTFSSLAPQQQSSDTTKSPSRATTTQQQQQQRTSVLRHPTPVGTRSAAPDAASLQGCRDAYHRNPLIMRSFLEWSIPLDSVTGPHAADSNALYFPFVAKGAMLNPGGKLDGGVAVEMIAILTTFHVSAVKRTPGHVSIALNVAYLRALPAGRKASLRSYIRKDGRHLTFVEAHIVDAEDPQLVYATATHIKASSRLEVTMKPQAKM